MEAPTLILKPNTMTNLALSNESSKQVYARGNMQLAKAALQMATAPKLIFRVEDVEDKGEALAVVYTDQFDNEYEKFIPKANLIEFVGEHYRDTVDTFFDDQHYQYVDGRSNAEYFEEYTNDVITDFLNARR